MQNYEQKQTDHTVRMRGPESSENTDSGNSVMNLCNSTKRGHRDAFDLLPVSSPLDLTDCNRTMSRDDVNERPTKESPDQRIPSGNADVPISPSLHGGHFDASSSQRKTWSARLR